MQIGEIVFYISLVALGLLLGRFFLPLASEGRALRSLNRKLESSEKTRERLTNKLQELTKEQGVLGELLQTLPTTAARLTESKHLDDVAEVVGEAVMRLFGATEVAVLLRDKEKLKPVWTRTVGGGKRLKDPFPVPGGRIGASLKAGTVLSSEDFKGVTGLPVSPKLWAPIRHRGELLGVIHLGKTPGKGKEGRRFLSILASLASISFRSIELYEQLASFNKQLEEKAHERTVELRRAYEELKELDRAKDEFISSVSHELRTPLTSIRSFSELLLTFDDSDEERRQEFLTIINDESKRLTRLIGDVLDVAKIESGQSEWRLRKLDVVDLVKSTVELQKPAAAERDIELKVVEGPGLHAVIADRDRIQQVVMNLLSNAIKFSYVGDEVVVSSEIEGSEIVICVADHGIGIPEEDRERVFMRFQQLGEIDTGKHPGTGLGLAICKEIVSRHGGRVWVEDNEPKGCRFLFSLPALPDESEEAQ